MAIGFQAPDDWGYTGYDSYSAPVSSAPTSGWWSDTGSGIDPSAYSYGLSSGSDYLPISPDSYLYDYTMPYDSSSFSQPSFWDSLVDGNWGDAGRAALSGLGSLGLEDGMKLGLGGLSLLGNYLASREQRKDARDQFNRTLGFKEKELESTQNTDLAKYDALASILEQRDRAQLDPRRYAEIVASGEVPIEEMISRPTRMMASGGLNQVQGLLRGGSPGQADDVNASLSHGEYVFDADSVAALGDGNTEAGARRLDRMREEIRRHKRGASAKSIPPPAKDPLMYLKGGK